jgi:hypothetical protein
MRAGGRGRGPVAALDRSLGCDEQIVAMAVMIRKNLCG